MTTSILKKRCYHCNKKIKLIEYACRCNEIFCQKCRMPESHNCTFDYKNKGKTQLAQNLPLVKCDKVIKI